MKRSLITFRTVLFFTFQNYFSRFLKFIQELGPKIIYNTSLCVKFEITVQITFLLPYAENIWYLCLHIADPHSQLQLVLQIIDYYLCLFTRSSIPFLLPYEFFCSCHLKWYHVYRSSSSCLQFSCQPLAVSNWSFKNSYPVQAL